MSTLLDVVNSLRTELNSQLSIPTTSEIVSDYETALVRQVSNTTLYQLRQQYQQAAEGNVIRETGAIELEIRHKLADGFNERAYTEGAMQTQQSTLLRKSFWSALTGVFQVEGGPEIEEDVSREGNIIRWSVLVTFLITP